MQVFLSRNHICHHIFDGGETLAVLGAKTMCFKGFEVVGRAVARISHPPILGVLIMQFCHDAVARDLGDD